MALDGGVGIANGISKRPSQINGSVAVEKAARRADEATEEEDEGKPWVARKWITSLAVCLAALPLLAIMVSRRDGPLPLPSGWRPATTTRTYDRTGRNHPIRACLSLHLHLAMACSILQAPWFQKKSHGDRIGMEHRKPNHLPIVMYTHQEKSSCSC
jgi:hypothetical protein